MTVEALFHFSEAGDIERFEPHVPVTNPSQQPAVWAIDGDHAPLYWFPRDCPRAAVWPRDDAERIDFEQAFATNAPRVHAVAWSWWTAMHTTTLFRYRFDPAPFRPWPDASGQWVSTQAVVPLAVDRVEGLVDLHAAAGIELRAVPDLAPFVALAVSDRWDFSIVRFRPRT